MTTIRDEQLWRMLAREPIEGVKRKLDEADSPGALTQTKELIDELSRLPKADGLDQFIAVLRFLHSELEGKTNEGTPEYSGTPGYRYRNVDLAKIRAKKALELLNVAEPAAQIED